MISRELGSARSSPSPLSKEKTVESGVVKGVTIAACQSIQGSISSISSETWPSASDLWHPGTHRHLKNSRNKETNTRNTTPPIIPATVGPTGRELLVSEVLGNDVPVVEDGLGERLADKLLGKGRNGTSSSWLEHHQYNRK